MHKQTKGCILLLLCAMIWGAAFVAQSEGMQYVGPFTMGATRFFLAGLVLLPVIRVLDRKGWSQNRPVTKEDKKRQLAAGAICGVLLFAATTLQQFGLLDTTVGKSGFVTALYIVFVPIVGVLTGKKAGLRVWLCAAAAVFGMYLLCVGSGFSVAGGDLLTLGCAVLFTFHICYISAVSPRMDGVRLSCVQFFVCSALSAIGMFVFESPDWASIRSCWLPIVYAGVFSGGVAYTFQIIGERDVQPALASLLMSLESVFAALFGWILIGQGLSGKELIGCAIMFAAILLSQLPERRTAGLVSPITFNWLCGKFPQSFFERIVEIFLDL